MILALLGLRQASDVFLSAGERELESWYRWMDMSSGNVALLDESKKLSTALVVNSDAGGA
jgi:hypothetical protein